MYRNDVIAYVSCEYDISPDYPWVKTPNYAVFRHPHNRKWFGVIVSVTKNKLGLKGREPVDALLLKCDPLLIGSLLNNPGILPGYHMNKEHWIIIVLDDTVPQDDVCNLINLSYQITISGK